MSEVKKIKPVVKISKEKGKSRCPVISNIEIFMDGQLVATAKLGGDYSPEQVVKSLKGPDRKRFTVKNELLFGTL